MDEQIRKFITYNRKKDSEGLEKIRSFAIEKNVPIIKDEMKELLKVQLLMYKPKRILEIGTAVGYSSLVMASVVDDDCKITTIERDEKMIGHAKKHFATYDKKQKIRLLSGDAAHILCELEKKGETFDFIFMDAAKGQYLNFFPPCDKMLLAKGVFVADNVMQNGDVIKSRFSIPRRQRTIHVNMRDYLWEISHRKDYDTAILTVADGVTISVKK